MNNIEKAITLTLIFSCVFDPSNKLLSLKYIAFSTLITTLIINQLLTKRKFSSKATLIVTTVALVIPTYGATILNIRGNNGPWEAIFSSYLFITISIFIRTHSQINFFEKTLVLSTTILSSIIFSIFIYLQFFQLKSIADFGSQFELFWLGYRQYGGVVFPTIFYKTSPLIVVGLTYWSYNLAKEQNLKNIILTALCIIGLLFSGTRNGILLSIAIPTIIITAKVKKLRNYIIIFFTASFIIFIKKYSTY